MTLSRRNFLIASTTPLLVGADADDAPHNAMGERIGEVTDRSAIIHTRLTAAPARNNQGHRFPGVTRKTPIKDLPRMPQGMRVEELEGACPGKAGRVRLLYGTRADLKGARQTAWADAMPEHDFTHQFRLDDLQAGAKYFYAVEMRALDGRPIRRGATGAFRAAPAPDQFRPITFCASTCQHDLTRDAASGFLSYEAMRRLAPDFTSMIGDNVYYDSEPPLATTEELARHFWHRTYSLPSLVEYYRNTPCYWTKDDHDVLKDDCWPGVAPGMMSPMTFEDGLRIFREQIPISDPSYRRFRWGRGLEVWLTEGRDYRSPNNIPDGAEKTIWGREQKEWLKRTLLESDAAFRVLISPTPIVGPDRPAKGDNHANAAFAAEGREFRAWVKQQKLTNLVVICGDRHWQYHSVDPETGLQEFSVGPMSDEHAGGTPGEDKHYHRFHRVKGGFLSVSLAGTARAPQLVFRFRDVSGNVVYEYATNH
ncbi:MAG: alkaline phosphatase D family protein [Blastocatellia bacterium]